MKIVIATKNKNKIREIEHKFRGIPGIIIADTSLYPGLPDVEETGETFMQNALLKASAIAAHTGLPSLADDSGLEVDALMGRPGVYSARYGGPGLSDGQRNSLLLEEMKSIPPEKRTARFVCSMVLCMPDQKYFHAEGTCEGFITESPRGDRGFGYDPVFFLPEYNCTMAELPLEEKNMISHRARAIEKTAAIVAGLA